MSDHPDIHQRLTVIENTLGTLLASMLLLIDGMQQESEINTKLISATMALIDGHTRALDQIHTMCATVQNGPTHDPLAPSIIGESAAPRPQQKGDSRDKCDDTTRTRQGTTRVCEHDPGEAT